MITTTQPFDYEADAQAAWDTIYGGGIAIFTSHVGYAMCSATKNAIDKIFKVKRRTPQKFHAMSGNMNLHNEIHIVDQRAKDVLSLITEGFDLPLGTIAPVKLDPGWCPPGASAPPGRWPASAPGRPGTPRRGRRGAGRRPPGWCTR